MALFIAFETGLGIHPAGLNVISAREFKGGFTFSERPVPLSSPTKNPFSVSRAETKIENR
jgi:hypothetical protein